MRVLLALCLLMPGVLQADEDWHQILHHIANVVGDAVNKTDNYICVQDLSRFYYVAASSEMACRQPPTLPSTPLRVQDRLKLDVAVSQGGEIYSWHGAKKFASDSVSDVVKEGPISSGSFNGYLRNIFGERGISVTYLGRKKLKDVEVYQFDYSVPLASSHYSIQAGKSFEIAPFHGSFSARTDTFELYSLTVTADGDKISTKTNICSATSSLTYQVVKIANHESVVPAQFDLMMGSRNGTFTESKGVYSECHEYKGESTVKFDAIDDNGTAGLAAQVETQALGAGLILPIGLKTDIDEDTAYSGLPVDAVLQRDVKIKKGLKIAKGAILHGTLTQFDIFYEPAHSVSLRLEFESITDGNKIYQCDAIHHMVAGFLPTYQGGGMRGRRGGGMGPTIRPGSSGDSEDGAIMINARHVHLDKGYSSEFITVNHAVAESR